MGWPVIAPDRARAVFNSTAGKIIAVRLSATTALKHLKGLNSWGGPIFAGVTPRWKSGIFNDQRVTPRQAFAFGVDVNKSRIRDFKNQTASNRTNYELLVAVNETPSGQPNKQIFYLFVIAD